MNPDWTTWHRPTGSRLWQLVGRSPDRSSAWALLFDDTRSGGWFVCEPGRPEPEPQSKRTPKPKTQRVIRWD